MEPDREESLGKWRFQAWVGREDAKNHFPHVPNWAYGWHCLQVNQPQFALIKVDHGADQRPLLSFRGPSHGLAGRPGPLFNCGQDFRLIFILSRDQFQFNSVQFQFQAQVTFLAYLLYICSCARFIYQERGKEKRIRYATSTLRVSLLILLSLLISFLPHPIEDHIHILLLQEIHLPHWPWFSTFSQLPNDLYYSIQPLSVVSFISSQHSLRSMVSVFW